MTRRGPFHPHQPPYTLHYLETNFNWDSDTLKKKRDKSSKILEVTAQDNEWIRVSHLCRHYAEVDRGKGDTCPHCMGRGYAITHPEPARALCIAGTYENKHPIYLCECAHRHWPQDQLPANALNSKPLESWSM